MRTLRIMLFLLGVCLISAPCLAVTVYDEGGSGASWSEVDRQWEKWMVALQKETQSQLSDLQRYPKGSHASRLHAGFSFCACPDGKVKWAWVANVADMDACRRMVESKLAAQGGRCYNGKFRSVVIDQWKPSTFPSGRPSDHSGELVRAIMKQKHATEEDALGAQLKEAQDQCERGHTPERRADGCKKKKEINTRLLKLIERHDQEIKAIR